MNLKDTGIIYNDGYNEYLEGRSSTENPYEYLTDEYEAWDNGWSAAYDDTETYEYQGDSCDGSYEYQGD